MKSINRKKALVIGANGFLGQNLCYWLCAHDFEVIAVGRKEVFSAQDYFINQPISYIQADVSSLEEVATLPIGNVDVIYMMAGQTGTSAGFEAYQTYLFSNELSLLHVLHQYRMQNAKARIVFPSSRLVYKGEKEKLLKENDAKEAKTVYAANKIACEQYLNAWGNAFDVPYTILRICVPYGQLIPGNYSYGTLGFMLRQAKENKKITLYGEGEPARTFSHMIDLCELLGSLPMIESTNKQTINIGSKDNFSLKALALLIALKYDAEIEYKSWPALDLSIESGDTMFDDQKLQQVFPYTYEGSLTKYINNLTN